MTLSAKIRKTSKFVKTLMAGIVAASIATSMLVVPVMAGPNNIGGSFSITILPGNNTEEAQALRAGMALFNIINSLENGAAVRQNGINNSAGMQQNGLGNFGTIWQEGVGNRGTLRQKGNNNAYGIYQFGENTNVDISQFGNNQTGATFIFGF